MSERQRYFIHRFNSTWGYLSLPGLHILFHIFFHLFPYGFSLMFVLQLSLGLIYGMSLSLQLDWRLGSSQGQFGWKKMSWCVNTLMATTFKVPWCSWRSQAAFDTPSSFKILFDIWDVDLFLSVFPEMNLFHGYFPPVPLQCIRIILTHGSVTHRHWHFFWWNCLLMLSLKAQLLSIPQSQSKHFIYQGLTENAPEF